MAERPYPRTAGEANNDRMPAAQAQQPTLPQRIEWLEQHLQRLGEAHANLERQYHVRIAHMERMLGVPVSPTPSDEQTKIPVDPYAATLKSGLANVGLGEYPLNG